jgi:hypothetical protein
MKLKKIIGLTLLLLGLWIFYQNIENLIDRKQMREIQLYGEKVESVVISTDCKNTGIIKFKTSTENIIEFKLESDCYIFEVGNKQVFLHYEKYPDKYIFPNETHPLFGIIFLFGLMILVIMTGIILIKKAST